MDTGSEVVLESNHDYFEGRPYIDKYVYRVRDYPVDVFIYIWSPLEVVMIGFKHYFRACVHLVSLNGPMPTGFRPSSLFVISFPSSKCPGRTGRLPQLLSAGAKGLSYVTRKVYLSKTSAFFTCLKSSEYAVGVLSLIIVLYPNLTFSAVNSTPSVHFTPFLR